MREMIDEFKEKPNEDAGEDRLEQATMTRKERRAQKKADFKEYTSTMSKKEKTAYIIRYYFPAAAIVLVVVAIITGIAVTVYNNTRPITLSYAILNAENESKLNLTAFDEYAATKDTGKKTQLLSDTRQLDPTAFALGTLTYTVEDEYTGFNLICKDGYYDVIITNAAGLNYLAEIDAVQLLDEYLPAELYDRLSDKIIRAKDSYGDMYESGINISDTAFAKSLNTGYDKVYIAFTGTTDENYERAMDFLEYILE